ncbi:MAG TPA: zinc-dependent metalloprotease [Fluviicola sp.]|nr:zinc-dependent metalloprotease [Fluviicola sp.]
MKTNLEELFPNLRLQFLRIFIITLLSECIYAQGNIRIANPHLSVSQNIEVSSESNIIETMELFSESPESNSLNSQNDEVISEATYLTLDTAKLKIILDTKPGVVKLRLKRNDGKKVEIELLRYEILSERFTSGIVESMLYKQMDYQPGLYYRGVVVGEENTIVAMSFFEEEVQGVIADAQGNWVLGPLKNSSHYIYYNDKNLKPKFQFECGISDEGNLNTEKVTATKSMCPINVFWVGDFDFFGVSNYDVTTAFNNITAIFNNVAALYQQEGIVVYLSEIYVHTSPDFYDEWDSWNAFHSFGYQIHQAQNFDEDLAMLLAVNLNGNSQSYGVIDALCSNFVPQQSGKYAYSRIETYAYAVPTYSWTIYVVTHEMGHNLGSRHTHWCGWPGGAIDNCSNVEPDAWGNFCNPGPFPSDGGTIMSYCALMLGSINFNNGFGYYPHQEITTDVNSASTCLCLGIEESNALLFDVWPNPSNDYIEVQYYGGDFELRIFNYLGQVVMDCKNQNKVDVAFLSKGVYLVVLFNNNRIGIKKFIKE